MKIETLKNSDAHVMKRIFFFLFFASLFLTSCVSTPHGGKKFSPWEGAQHMDKHVDDWLENRGYPIQRPDSPPPPSTYNQTSTR
ncbi:MAG: hypothetical protein ABI615_11710 [Chthoniobacterales bacterium]